MTGLVVVVWLAASLFTADGRLNDPALEARAEHLGHELRCLVCENSTIEDSPAPLAADLRRLVRERIAAGDSDAEVRQWLADRYGEFVLFRPPFDARNLALWAGPFVLLGVAATLLLLHSRRRKRPAMGLPESEEADISVRTAALDPPKTADLPGRSQE